MLTRLRPQAKGYFNQPKGLRQPRKCICLLQATRHHCGSALTSRTQARESSTEQTCGAANTGEHDG